MCTIYLFKVPKLLEFFLQLEIGCTLHLNFQPVDNDFL